MIISKNSKPSESISFFSIRLCIVFGHFNSSRALRVRRHELRPHVRSRLQFVIDNQLLLWKWPIVQAKVRDEVEHCCHGYDCAHWNENRYLFLKVLAELREAREDRRSMVQGPAKIKERWLAHAWATPRVLEIEVEFQGALYLFPQHVLLLLLLVQI